MPLTTRPKKTTEAVQDDVSGAFDGSLNYDDPADLMQVAPGRQALWYTGL